MKNDTDLTTPDSTIFLRPSRFWAQHLDVCSATIDRARKRGELGCTRLGARVLYSPAQIRAWLDAHASSGANAE